MDRLVYLPSFVITEFYVRFKAYKSLVRDRLGTQVTEIGQQTILFDFRRIRTLKPFGHTDNHQVLNYHPKVPNFPALIF